MLSGMACDDAFFLMSTHENKARRKHNIMKCEVLVCRSFYKIYTLYTASVRIDSEIVLIRTVVVTSRSSGLYTFTIVGYIGCRSVVFV